jgi:hypothetical protein
LGDRIGKVAPEDVAEGQLEEAAVAAREMAAEGAEQGAAAMGSLQRRQRSPDTTLMEAVDRHGLIKHGCITPERSQQIEGTIKAVLMKDPIRQLQGITPHQHAGEVKAVGADQIG